MGEVGMRVEMVDMGEMAVRVEMVGVAMVVMGQDDSSGGGSGKWHASQRIKLQAISA